MYAFYELKEFMEAYGLKDTKPTEQNETRRFEMTEANKKPKKLDIWKQREQTRKQLMIDKLETLSYIHHGAKLHGEEQGAERWLERLSEAINIAVMLELLTDDEINAAIKTGKEESENDNK